MPAIANMAELTLVSLADITAIRNKTAKLIFAEASVVHMKKFFKLSLAKCHINTSNRDSGNTYLDFLG
jgi:hypothetical protein